ncbi:hypothetical protein J3R82DRAFT_777 [Butyriboletus roseoflavus]|nr:hypothetical protein J3R82DRAFT_777 [Butyriboletus roseoflavus]
MANTDPKDSGVHAWMASVRTSMANDPCRQLFEDQLQTHAFIFLDDYLEHILAGQKQAIIELVKTPGRKKNIPRRTRAATAAAANVKNATSFSLDGNNSTIDVVPVNSFHRALLEVKERSAQDALDPRKSSSDLPSTSDGPAKQMHGRSNSAQVPDIPEITVAIELDPQAGAIPLQHYPRDLPSESSTHFPTSERGTTLSVIAEGDESPERSHANNLSLFTIVSKQEESPEIMPRFCHSMAESPAAERNSEIIPIDYESQEDPAAYARSSAPLSVNACHPIPFGSPREVQSSEARTGNRTEPLPSQAVIHSPSNHERNAFTAPLPLVPVSNSILIPHTISVPLNDSSPRTLAHKSGTAGFPMLPAPSPLRKSMRVAQEALTGSALATTAPAPAPLGKRTSWLMKAREAKAMEGTNSLPGTSVAATFPRVSTAVKRKSGEVFGALPPGPEWDKDQRRPKLAKSTEVDILISKATEKNNQRDSPPVQGEPVTLSCIAAAMPVDQSEFHAMNVDEQTTYLNPAEEGFIDLFKRTVEGLGARAGKSMGKSLGGAAVAALAEARAAAEAKVAERNKVDSESSDSEALRDDGLSDQEPLEPQAQSDEFPFVPVPRAGGTGRRLSLSDLALDTVQPHQPELSTKTARAKDVGTRVNNDDESISTTPPDSPPFKGSAGFVKPAGPVFNKPPPPPVFMPPASKQLSVVSGHPKEFSFNIPSGQLTLPVAMSLGIPARIASLTDGIPPLIQGTSQMSAQSSQSSIFSEPVFDKHDGVPTWVPSTQDTSYTIDSQARAGCATAVVADDDDDDDSWPLEEKLAAAEPGWRPFDFSNVDKEDTWSSLPTESQGPTRILTPGKNGDAVPLPNNTDVEVETNDEEVEREQEAVEVSDTERSVMEVSELEEVAETRVASLDRVEPTARGTSQTSMTSTASSSQSQAGFFSQATKLVNSMLGSKKAKPELKSLQLAAAAAKRQQEEADKKTQRLKDMEARRQVAIAKKAEERTRLLEEEKKSKEEFEKRKREREENTDRRPLKHPVSTKKAEDDASKKRRLAPETEKKPESKKPPLKDKKDLAPSTKLGVTPATKLAAQRGAKASTTALVSSAAYNATQNALPAPSAKPIIPEAKPFKVVPSSLKGKAKAKIQEDDMGDKFPSTMVQSQMAARAKAQMQAAKLSTPEVPSESIELPDINSEYSNSEDEDRVRTFDPPGWAQSPELRQALQMQSTVNPDDIFGGIRPLRMEEMFRTRHSRFRARTSSANWTGSDRLTVEEIREYERRMGFQQTRAS